MQHYHNTTLLPYRAIINTMATAGQRQMGSSYLVYSKLSQHGFNKLEINWPKFAKPIPYQRPCRVVFHPNPNPSPLPVSIFPTSYTVCHPSLPPFLPSSLPFSLPPSPFLPPFLILSPFLPFSLPPLLLPSPFLPHSLSPFSHFLYSPITQ